ncbi:MAG: response regulator transcription factor [Rubrobacteraceae bacterium]
MAISIIITESHPTTRVGIRRLFETEEDMKLVGEAGTVREALTLVEKLNPDILLTDLMLGEKGNGIELCERTKSLPNSPHVVFHTAYNSTKELILCRFSKADGYVHKGEKPGKLLEAIRYAYCGGKPWCIGQEVEELDVQLRVALERNVLTPRELEVFELLRRRRTDAEISAELYVSLGTVNTHVTNVLRKLGCRSRLDLS